MHVHTKESAHIQRCVGDSRSDHSATYVTLQSMTTWCPGTCQSLFGHRFKIVAYCQRDWNQSQSFLPTQLHLRLASLIGPAQQFTQLILTVRYCATPCQPTNGTNVTHVNEP